MRQRSRVTSALRAVATVLSVLFTLGLPGYASDRQGRVTEEFHQVYTISPEGRIELENINGSVHITSWDRNEVKVDAIKRAWTKERLDEARIEIDSHSSSLSIRTEYPHNGDSFWNGRHHDPASGEYTLFVPPHARLHSTHLLH